MLLLRIKKWLQTVGSFYKHSMKTSDIRWAFFSYGNNLGDFTRALEVARGMKASGAQLRFFNHGGIHNHLIRQAGIEMEDLRPELSWEQHEKIMDINRYKAPVGTPLPVTTAEWIAMAEADLEAFQRYRPDGVYAGLNLSCMISVPYAKLPMVTQVPTVNCPAFIHKELYNMPNIMERNFFTRHVLPGFVKRKIMKRILLKDSAKDSLITFNEARQHFGLKPIYNIVELVRGDITLLPDLPELSGLPEDELTPGYHYTAPVFAHLDMPVPPEVQKVFGREGINVYCSFGSSGFPETLKAVVGALRSRPELNVVCSTTTILKPEALGPPDERFFACEFLPAHRVNEMADIAVTHGGQGTIQTAIWAGTPVIGIGFQAEQQANIDGLVRAGMGVRIPLYAVSAQRILKAVSQVNAASYRSSAGTMQQKLRATDGVKRSVDLMNDFIRNRKGKSPG